MVFNRQQRALFVTASLLTYLLVTLGGIVCVTDSSRGCPDWPGCYGRVVPPLRLDSILEYTHRVLAALTSLAIIASAIVGWWKARAFRWLSWSLAIAVALLCAVIAFGAMVVLRGLGPGLAALDLGAALLVLALVLTATVMAVAWHQNPRLPDHLSFDTAYARLTAWTLVVVWIVLVSGVLVAESGSMVRCLGWPLYGEPWNLIDARDGFREARRLAGGVAGALIVAVVVQAWRVRGQQGRIRAIAAAVGVAFGIETAIGFVIVVHDPSVWLYVLYAATAVALWALIVMLVVWAGLISPKLHQEVPPARQTR